MSSRKESIIFLVNVGVVRYGMQNDSQLLDKTKFILKHTIQKKIFLRPKDEIGVVLMGSGVDNVEELCRMQIGNWNLIETIEKLKPTNQSCSWMEALHIAVAYIKHECVNKNTERKILLLSDFNEEEDIVNQFEVDTIAEELSSEEILLIAVGERTLDNLDKDSLTASEALLMEVLQKTDGHYLTFELAMSDVRFYKRPSTKPMPWCCHMILGDFSIPIIGISKMPNKVKFPDVVLENTSDVPDEQVAIENVAQLTDNSRIVHTGENTISGYVYGGRAIPVSDESKTNMTHISTEKCYKIHAFTMKKNIPMEYWFSDGSYVIVPANESVSAPFYSLVQAMINKNVVAIVEKVYRTNLEANMVALFPSVDIPNEPWCLIEIGLPFEQDYEAITPRPLKFVMKQLSEDQSEAINNLLESLELPDADDNTHNVSEKYLPGYMPDPGAQNVWDMLSARALNPNKPLPPVADDVKNLLEQLEFVKERCEKLVKNRINDLFSLEKKKSLKAKKRKRSNEDTQADNDTAIQQSTIENKTDSKKDKIEESKNTDVSNVCRFDFDEIADL